MNITVMPSKISGTIQAPPSKSFTHRAIFLASMARGESTIKNVLLSNDTEATIIACEKLGAKIEKKRNTLKIKGAYRFTDFPEKTVHINCKDSGTTARLITSIAVLKPGKTTIDGTKRMRQRPMKDLIETLTKQGARIKDTDGFLPVTIIGGKLKGGKIEISGKKSSQFISSLLIVLPYAQHPSEVIVTDLQSKPYVDITIDLMNHFGILVKQKKYTYIIPNGGYTRTNYTVEGDFSSASYLLAAAAVSSSDLTVLGLNPDSKQGDKKIISILQMMECKIKLVTGGFAIKGKATKPVIIDMGNYPDIVPTIAAVAATIPGKTIMKNIAHLRHKESDRIHSIKSELSKFGAKVDSQNGSLTIRGGQLHGANINTHNDHRIAMSMAVAAISAIGDTTINDAQVVEKSYKHFWTDLKKIGVKIL